MKFEEVRPISTVAMNILKKRYFFPEETTWFENVDRIIKTVVPNDYEHLEILRDIINFRYFLPNSPCIANSGKKNGGLIACFVVPMDDSIESIYKAKLDFALVAKKGGGCGTTLSKVRPKNAKVSGSAHGYAGGNIDFFNTICHDMEVMTQSGFRSMAMMGTCSCYHPDILKFINAKEQEGKMSTTNISVVVDDAFMNKVEKDEEYTTFFDYPNERVYGDTYKARDIFNMIVEGAWRNGEPGLIFYDRVNEGPYKHANVTIDASNPCFTYDSKILTNNGYVEIGSLENKTVEIIDANGFSQYGRVWKSGEKETIQLRLSNKQIIKCTPNHILMNNNGESIEAKDSKGIQLMPFLNYRELDRKFTLFGFMQGDGDLGRLKSNAHLGVEINIGKKDSDIYELLNGHKYTVGERKVYIQDVKNELIKLGFDSSKLPERKFPTSYLSWNIFEKASFLRGCFSANGTINNYARICYKTTSKDFVLELQKSLNDDFGISSFITTNKSHDVKFSNGTYKVKEGYDLNISEYESKLIFNNEINFIQTYKIEKLANQLISTSPYITSIKEIGKNDVYDFSIPEFHWGVVNGFVVHNCGEQPLPPYGSCNLGSIDLSKFYNKEIDELDYNKLEMAIRLGCRFLDFVIDKNSFPAKDFEDVAKKSRPIGLGSMGWADLFLMKKLAYGSKDSLEYMKKVETFITKISISESEMMGEEYGIPEWCERLPYPRRNITTRTQAPTGTISLIAGCNSGIEPIFSEITIRNDKTGTYQFEHDLASKEYFRCAVASNGAKEVTWEEHVAIQAIAQTSQKYNDNDASSGTSKTINFPSHTHRETIRKAFIEAWKTGCKGITVYRNGSRSVEVLSPKNLKKDKCPVCEADIIKYDGCKKCSKCDWSLCEVS